MTFHKHHHLGARTALLAAALAAQGFCALPVVASPLIGPINLNIPTSNTVYARDDASLTSDVDSVLDGWTIPHTNTLSTSTGKSVATTMVDYRSTSPVGALLDWRTTHVYDNTGGTANNRDVAQSEGIVNFTTDYFDIGYNIEGLYWATGLSFVYQEAYLFDLTMNSYLFRTISYSSETADESLKLGESSDGDLFNYLEGSTSGTLSGYHMYEFFYRQYIFDHHMTDIGGVSRGVATSASGHICLALGDAGCPNDVPEPNSLALVALAIFGLGAGTKLRRTRA